MNFFGIHLDLDFKFKEIFGIRLDLDLVSEVQDCIWIVKYESPLISVEDLKWFRYLFYKLSREKNPGSHKYFVAKGTRIDRDFVHNFW